MKSDCFLYLIECGEFYKLGFSDDVEKRLSTLQHSVPFKMQIVFMAKFEDRYKASQLETFLHKKFKPYCVHREWFKFPKDKIEEVKHAMSKECEPNELLFNQLKPYITKYIEDIMRGEKYV
jgi:hypothetical protein